MSLSFVGGATYRQDCACDDEQCPPDYPQGPPYYYCLTRVCTGSSFTGFCDLILPGEQVHRTCQTIEDLDIGCPCSVWLCFF